MNLDVRMPYTITFDYDTWVERRMRDNRRLALASINFGLLGFGSGLHSAGIVAIGLCPSSSLGHCLILVGWLFFLASLYAASRINRLNRLPPCDQHKEYNK